jgi:glycosyltransferase involved in cell wall biosynthesis
MKTAIITIAIPVYNRVKYFEEAIASALNQTVSCRICVVDNCSEHDEFEKYVKDLNNPDVSYHRNSINLGMIGNWNKCIELAETPWLTILHDDDTLHLQYIENVLKVIEADTEVGLISGKTIVEKSEPVGFNKVLNGTAIRYLKNSYFLYRNLSPFPGVSFKKSLAMEVNGFDPSLHPISDIHFWYKISRLTKTVVIDEKLAFYRISEEQETFTKVAELVNLTKDFRQMVLKQCPNSGLLTRLSVLHANQNLIEYFNNRYPASHLHNENLGWVLDLPLFRGMIMRVKERNSYQ